MPLAFETRSHGTIAVGFFNIESDMILVGHYFLFASDLCSWIASWAAGAPEAFAEERSVWPIRDPARLGNLQGAMGGWDLSGFIGAVYRRFPFPQRREDFRQRPEGYQTRAWMERVIEDHASAATVLLGADPLEQTFSFGEYVFPRESWAEVLSYLWMGGMPRWAAAGPPAYVTEMHEAVTRSRHWLFAPAG